MFSKLNHYLQKFSYTRLDDDQVELRPLILKVGELNAYSILERHIKENKLDNVVFDKTHHEIFIKNDLCEATFHFTNDEDGHAIVSISTYSEKKGVSYKELIKTKEEAVKVFESYIISK